MQSNVNMIDAFRPTTKSTPTFGTLSDTAMVQTKKPKTDVPNFSFGTLKETATPKKKKSPPVEGLLAAIVMNLASNWQAQVPPMRDRVAGWTHHMLQIELWNVIEQSYDYFYVHGSSLSVNQRIILNAIRGRTRCDYDLSECIRAWFANPAEPVSDDDSEDDELSPFNDVTRGSLFHNRVAESTVEDGDIPCLVIREKTESLFTK